MRALMGSGSEDMSQVPPLTRQAVESLNCVVSRGHHDGSTLQRFSATCHIRPGRLKPDVTLPISAVEISLAWLKALLAAVRIMSSSNWASLALIACGSILIEAIV